MTDLLGAFNWANFQSLINDAHDTFNQATVVWYQSKGGLDREGEDNLSETFNQITLKTLIQYADKVTWPISQYTESGMIDKSNQVCLFNMDYLRGLGFIDADGEFIFDQDADRIKCGGVLWKCSASTNLSQAPDRPLLCMIVLQKEITATGIPNKI